MLGTQIGARTQTEEIPYITTTADPSPTVEEVRVDMAGMKAASAPVELVTSVGSCVALCLYDPANKCGGLAHIMLPDSSVFPHELLPYKFADTAVPALAEEIRKINRNKAPLIAKIAGGANMFPKINNGTLSVGEKNVDSVKTALTAQKVKLLAEDVGGSCGRRISFNVVTGVVAIRRYTGEVKKL